MKKDAEFSEDRRYRWVLEREWKEGGKLVTFIMLNPSYADDCTDDRTITRCIGFAKKWNCGRLKVVNLFALVSTDPKRLVNSEDPVGVGNDKHILSAVREADLVVCAWGNNVSHIRNGHIQVEKVLEAVKKEKKKPHHLGLTKKGHPKHPGRLSIDTQFEPCD